MRFYYTGAKIFKQNQTDPLKSIGGFISGTVIPNNSFDNLFGEISDYTSENNIEEFRGIALKNETGKDITGISLTITYPLNPLAKFEFSKAELKDNEMERLSSANSTPYIANLIEPLIPMLLGDLKKDEYLGLWIKRTALTNPKFAIDTSLLETYLQNENKIEQIGIVLTWD